MNIIEAFKASNCGKARRRVWLDGETVGLKYDAIFAREVLEDDWEPAYEQLTFERIKKECVAGKTLLTDAIGNERLYLGFNRERYLVTDYLTGDGCKLWIECEIKNWRIGGEWEDSND